MLLSAGGAFATNYYYANVNNVGSPANSDLKSQSSNPSSDCNDDPADQICAVQSQTAPVGGQLPSGASYTTLSYGTFNN